MKRILLFIFFIFILGCKIDYLNDTKGSAEKEKSVYISANKEFFKKHISSHLKDSSLETILYEKEYQYIIKADEIKPDTTVKIKRLPYYYDNIVKGKKERPDSFFIYSDTLIEDCFRFDIRNPVMDSFPPPYDN